MPQKSRRAGFQGPDDARTRPAAPPRPREQDQGEGRGAEARNANQFSYMIYLLELIAYNTAQSMYEVEEFVDIQRKRFGAAMGTKDGKG